MTFIVLLFIILLYYILRNNKGASKLYISIVTIILIIISGSRHESVGTDTIAYLSIYEHNQNITWDYVLQDFFLRVISPTDHNSKDPGYLIFMKILHTCHIDTRMFLYVIATMLLIPLGVFIYKNSENLKIVLFSYCFYITLFYHYLPNSAIRQSLAFSFILWSYILLSKRKVLTSIILITIAATIHKSALISLLIIPFIYYKNIELYYKLILIPFLIFLLFPSQIARFLVDGNDIYSGYAAGSYYGNNSRPYSVILLISFCYILGWIYIKNINKTMISNKYILLIGCAFTFLFVPLVWANPNALRIISYFAPCMSIIVGMSLSHIRNLKIIYPLLLLLFLYLSVSKNEHYLFMWQSKVNSEISN